MSVKKKNEVKKFAQDWLNDARLKLKEAREQLDCACEESKVIQDAELTRHIVKERDKLNSFITCFEKVFNI